MSEYYDALASAVANLKPADQPARYAFYDRARRLVLQRLQAVDPPMADADIRTEMNAFNAAIRQLENDIVRPPKPTPAPKPAPPPAATPAQKPAPPQAAAPTPTRPPPASRPTAQPVPQQPGSLEIPPEFVGEQPQVEEKIAAEETPVVEAEFVPPPQSPGASPAPARSDPSIRKLGVVIAAALVVCVLGAGAYMLLGRTAKPPVRTAAPPPAPATTNRPPTSTPSTSPPARIAVREPERPTADGDNMPYILRRQLVYYRTTHPPGTLVISKSQNFLYVVRPNSTAMRYTIGMAPDASEASGLYQISRKEGLADGLSLGDSKFRIKQANAPITIGRMSPGSGFQLVAEDFTDLYNHTDLGTRVVVAN